MRSLPVLLVFACSSFVPCFAAERQAPTQTPEWNFNATIIEACSCPMFCQCYFAGEPAGHGGGGEHAGHAGMEHFCKFNNAYRVNKGTYGTVKLDGAKFWLAGDLGGEFAKGKAVWAVMTFDPSVTKEQREALKVIAGVIYPMQWDSFEVKEAPMEWSADKDKAHATLNGGKSAEVILKRSQASANTDEPTVIKNLKYWGTLRNDGFVLMQNEVQAYREGPKAFEFKGTNGFMITLDVTSKDAPKK
jgi:hypothetical protein